MVKNIDKQVTEKIKEFEEAFLNNPNVVQERKEYLEKTNEFLKENLPVKYSTLYRPFDI